MGGSTLPWIDAWSSVARWFCAVLCVWQSGTTARNGFRERCSCVDQESGTDWPCCRTWRATWFSGDISQWGKRGWRWLHGCLQLDENGNVIEYLDVDYHDASD